MSAKKLSVSEFEKLQKEALEKAGVSSLFKDIPKLPFKLGGVEGLFADYSYNPESVLFFSESYLILTIYGVVEGNKHFLGSVECDLHKNVSFDLVNFKNVRSGKVWVDEIRSEFVVLKSKYSMPLSYLVGEPDEEVLKLKTIFNNEDDYLNFLFVIENAIANSYLVDVYLKDKFVVKSLNNLLNNFDKKISFFSKVLEQNIYSDLRVELIDDPISAYEVKLCIKHILWSIDNRSWLPGSRPYLEWLTHAMGLMPEDVVVDYERKIKKFCLRRGMSQKQINALLTNTFDDFDDADKIMDDDVVFEESVFFNLSDDEKFDFVIDNLLDRPRFFDMFFNDLLDSEKFDLAEKLCLLTIDVYPNFIFGEFLLARVYFVWGDFVRSKIWCDKILSSLKNPYFDSLDDSSKNTLIQDVKDLLKQMG
ncbi:MAG: hypothetical protein ACLFN8_01865 [Candidatus Woesearchaeota archaeon]